MTACHDCPRYTANTVRVVCCCDADLGSMVEKRKQEVRAVQGLTSGNRKARRAAEAKSRRA